MPKRGFAVVTIRQSIHDKVHELVQNPLPDEAATLSGFAEKALLKEIDRVEKRRKMQEAGRTHP